MLFNSVEFLNFFALVLASYWLLPGGRARILLLLAASYYFYMSWNAKLALVVAGSSLVDYGLALWMTNCSSPGRKKCLLTLSITMNMGLLVYFKYVNFFLASLHDLLAGIGFNHTMPVLDVVLPIGISFYTFEAISYTVDVYNGRTTAEKNPIHFLLFITFFPRMIAGPIIRARSFLPQLRRNRRFSAVRFQTGVEYVVMGLFKKLIIADHMAILSDPVFLHPHLFSTSGTWLAVAAYSIQIYCDFSGYSDIAIGTAHMMGFKLPQNFNMPYLSRNVSEFWRRWHISLSSWLRDYVFISLGGSRGTLLRTVFTLMMTMALCGLWHGAKWTFVVFGVAHGVMMVLHRFFQGFCKAWPGLGAWLETAVGIALRVAVTYVSVAVVWVFFRSQDMATAWDVFYRLFTSQHGMTVRFPLGPPHLALTVAALAAAHWLARSGAWRRISLRLTPPQWGVAYVTLSIFLVLYILLTPDAGKAFIYFQF